MLDGAGCWRGWGSNTCGKSLYCCEHTSESNGEPQGFDCLARRAVFPIWRQRFGQRIIKLTTYNLCHINMFLLVVNYEKFHMASGRVSTISRGW